MTPLHIPVMRAEVVELLAPGSAGVIVDCTVGLGGHAAALLEAGAGRLIGLDRDAESLALARERLAPWADRVELVHSDFRSLDKVLDARGLDRVAGVLVDLGCSSYQLEASGRGFSFLRDEPLDMRMDRSSGATAAEWLSAASEAELAEVIRTFGEERYARRVARAIVWSRARTSLMTTAELASVVRRAVPRQRHQRIDPATRTFQALRIWVNRELDGLGAFVSSVVRRLADGGRLVVIAFHSLEDRIVKHTLREIERAAEPPVRVLTRRPLRPTAAELAVNPRARSARLRAAERLAGHRP